MSDARRLGQDEVKFERVVNSWGWELKRDSAGTSEDLAGLQLPCRPTSIDLRNVEAVQ